MIQRIQSLWLLLSALCAALILFVPVFSGATADGLVKVFSIRENLILLLIVSLSIVIPFINIFLFKNRGLQKKLIINITPDFVCINLADRLQIKYLKY